MYSRVLKHIKPKDLRETISLRFTDVLNPVFWIGDSLRPEVREALMRFAKAFAEYVDLDDRAISDVILLGGNAGYNYTVMSDLDVHIVVDPKYIPDCNPDLLDEFYMDKKTLWELTHNVTILGARAEPYIERPGVTRKKSQGVYSLMRQAWIQKPEKMEDDLDEKELEKKVIAKDENVMTSYNFDEGLYGEIIKDWNYRFPKFSYTQYPKYDKEDNNYVD